MPLSDDMRDVDLKFECPNCSHPIVRKGSWFIVIASYICVKCRANVRIGYPEKLVVFERHRKLRSQ
ncbi:hypothetical protein C7I87_19090 [Mesorhizobium sp. SARCC-RB16n]|nr:hypothetical protein C7I87_19090 [Mesorhizobium sp. SARCC-RB16n]